MNDTDNLQFGNGGNWTSDIHGNVSRIQAASLRIEGHIDLEWAQQMITGRLQTINYFMKVKHNALLFGVIRHIFLSGLVSSVRRALTSKLRGPGFNSRPGTVGGPVTIIMWGARPGWKLALS